MSYFDALSRLSNTKGFGLEKWIFEKSGCTGFKR